MGEDDITIWLSWTIPWKSPQNAWKSPKKASKFRVGGKKLNTTGLPETHNFF